MALHRLVALTRGVLEGSRIEDLDFPAGGLLIGGLRVLSGKPADARRVANASLFPVEVFLNEAMPRKRGSRKTIPRAWPFEYEVIAGHA
jgi:hypothetical protein